MGWHESRGVALACLMASWFPWPSQLQAKIDWFFSVGPVGLVRVALCCLSVTT